MSRPARATRAGRPAVLPRQFYDRPTLCVAAELLGKVLVHRTPAGVTSGVIVEAEAYIGESDPACHAAPGPTRRNGPLYGPPGCAYVYFNYGVHHLVNVVTEPAGAPAAVLIRALEPLQGIPLMRRRRLGRGGTLRELPDDALCRGPGNLTRAMGITLAENCLDLCGSRLLIEDRGPTRRPIAWSGRIGIRVGTEQLWRCYLADSAAVSGARPRIVQTRHQPPSGAVAR